MTVLRRELEEIRDNIISRRVTMNVLIEIKKDLQKKISEIKDVFMEEIINALDEKNKPLYSNQTKRDSALKLQLETNDEYTKLLIKLDDVESKIKNNEIELEFYRYNFKIIDIVWRDV